MHRIVKAIILVAGAVAPLRAGYAAALTVAPISLDVLAPAQNAALTVQNREVRAVNAQVRIFRWSQPDGVDALDPTTAVIASPPIVQVGARTSYVVRLERVAGGEPAGEEAYRVIVDELPDVNRQRNGAVNVLLRYSVPLFFGNAEAAPPRLRWFSSQEGSRRFVIAQNDGDKRVQISGLSVKAGQKTLSIAPGLAGYVLGHSERRWSVPGKMAAGPMQLTAASDHGSISVTLAP